MRTAVLLLFLFPAAAAAQTPVNDTPGQPGEWGFRPHDNMPSAVTPPGFIWRPQKDAVSYHLQVSRDRSFDSIDYEAKGLKLFCHCPPETFGEGQWYWRFRFSDNSGKDSRWSRIRAFTIPKDAVAYPMSSRADLMARIPKGHPRLFVRPEEQAELRRRIAGDLKEPFGRLLQRCDAILKNPPPTEEPPKYPPDMERGGEEWRTMWWGNRVYTIKVLDSAALLAFTRWVAGPEKEEYGKLAKKLLMAAAEWDPKGATGYRYNDEAGMPYNYHFSRTYSFLHDVLGEEERKKCREVMKVRGEEMYRHLWPRHLWYPYGSHQNRAWHFLGEVGIAFLGEIPEAEEWLWFAMNVYFNAYPVWCDDDGGWHEGIGYWRSYVGRFTWWAEVMKKAAGIDAFRKPYFSKAGYYALYLQPPGTVGAAFGDMAPTQKSASNAALMEVLAGQAGNPHWKWYVEALGGANPQPHYIDFLRGAAPAVKPRAPRELPTSRVFRGIGLAVLNSDLTDASKNVQVVLKSSPFGSQSHGFEAQNSFALSVGGEALLIRTGRRDMHGSAHHVNWMWETRSCNSVLVDGKGQKRHSPAATGEIAVFETTREMDYAEGEAAGAYEGRLETFRRGILFIKPDVVVIFDRLKTADEKKSAFEWLLHAPNEMKVDGQGSIVAGNGAGGCVVSILAPEGLEVSQTDKFDPPPRERIKLKEWHLTAKTPQPAESAEFVTVIRPYRKSQAVPTETKLQKIDGGYGLKIGLGKGDAVVLLRTQPGMDLTYGGIATDGHVVAVRRTDTGMWRGVLNVGGKKIRRVR